MDRPLGNTNVSFAGPSSTAGSNSGRVPTNAWADVHGRWAVALEGLAVRYGRVTRDRAEHLQVNLLQRNLYC